MNIVLVVIDTLRYDHVGANGNPWIHTPSLDALAQRGVTFDRAYDNSFATIPCRTDLITARACPSPAPTAFGAAGTPALPFHPWAPLAWGVPTVPGLLRQSGYVCMLLCDTQHLINHGYGFDRPFHAWDLIRGQEVDRYSTEPMTRDDIPGDPEVWPHPQSQPSLPFPAATPEPFRLLNPGTRQYYRNRAAIRPRDETDYLPARLFRAAMRWVERNRQHEHFFLWIDCFDPHEPWDPPLADRMRYDPTAGGVDPVNPPRDASRLTPAQQRRAKALYAGEVTLVDRWLGRFLDQLDTLGLSERTAVIVTSDHGSFAGQHGRFAKGFPMYDEIAHLILCLRLPGDAAAGQRIAALVQPPDIARTILDLASVDPDWPVQGQSLLPLIRGEQTAIRDYTISGSARPGRQMPPITVNDGRWMLSAGLDRTRWLLFDNEADPGQERNLIETAPGEAARLHEAMIAELYARGTDPLLVRAYAEARPEGPAAEVAAGLAALAAATPRYDQFTNTYFL